MSTETQSEFWTEQYLGVPPRAQGAVDLVNELRDKHWTTDEWKLFLQLLGEDPDQNGLLEECFNEGYEVGKEDGRSSGFEDGESEGYDDGHREGIKDGEKRAEFKIANLTDIIRLCLPYIEVERKHPDHNPLYIAPLLDRIRAALK